MRSLHEQIALHGMEERFGDILVPTEEVVEMKEGKKRKSERKFYPGYVLVNMEMDDDVALVKACLVFSDLLVVMQSVLLR